jgi:Mannosylglycerate hydrolase MGH1-like glycoside hydrolase domain
MDAERRRIEGFGQLENGLHQASDWYLWGPYVTERQWGTVREDYSEDGSAWDYFPHDHARSRAYRWGEDGLAGFCDIEQRLCLGLALWNGRDPILKERLFGLTGPQGNHGEDVKEYWWYLDAIPSHAWNRWRYHYPQGHFPYDDLVATNAARNRFQPEYELLDTGVFDGDRYWIVEVCYAKDGPGDLLMNVSVKNAGPVTETLHVLPTAWFRNTWSWDAGEPKPVLEATGDAAVRVAHPFLGDLDLTAGEGPDDSGPAVLFCENETNLARLYNAAPTTPYPKDGINDHVISGAPTVNPDRRGTKCSFWYQLTLEPGATAELRLYLRPPGGQPSGDRPLGSRFVEVLDQRRAEADEFYAGLTPAAASADEALVMRQAFAGLLWSKQFYYFDVTRWLDGDPTQPTPPPGRRLGRNTRWGNFDAFDIMSMPDKWEYPWFAAWDLGFHCVALAHLDPAFAKYQLVLLCREWFQSPNGALPAYEWDFGDVNPPVQAWAALEVFVIDQGRDVDFLSRLFDKLLINFTWWVNREDAGGSNVFEGGFLGLDNIGPIDRSHLPAGGTLEQSDATGWMAFYAISMATIASMLYRSGQRPAYDITLKFLEHFADIADAINEQDMWDESDGLFYDKLLTADGTAIPMKVRSMVGVIPVLAAAVVDQRMLDDSLRLGKQFADFLRREGIDNAATLTKHRMMRGDTGDHRLLLSLVGLSQLEKLAASLFDESEFLSPYGLRALSAYHRDHPYVLDVEGQTSTVDYEPAESTTAMFGGNSNWRGPLWFPLNYLLIEVLGRYYRFFGDDLTLEYPTGSGKQLTLDAITTDLQDRLISIFVVGADGRRPCFGWVERLQQDPEWKDNLLFNEYFHGDNAAGLGASHQTGWTGVIADVIRRRHGAVPSVDEVVGALDRDPGAPASARSASPSGSASRSGSASPSGPGSPSGPTTPL